MVKTVLSVILLSTTLQAEKRRPVAHVPVSTRGSFAPEKLGNQGSVLSAPTSPQGLCVGM